MTNVIPFEYEEQDVRVIRDESGGAPGLLERMFVLFWSLKM